MMNGDNYSTPSNPRTGLDTSPDFIVITPPGSRNGEGSADPNEMGNFAFSVNMASLTSSHLSIEEALRRVMELMKENQELKDTLFKSNLAMKQACQSLNTWKETHDKEKKEIEKERKDFQMRHAQVRDVILKLQAAVEEKTDRLLQAESQFKQLSSDRGTPSLQKDMLELRKQIAQSNDHYQESMKQLESLKKENENLKKQNDELLQESAMIHDSESDLKSAIQAMIDEKKSMDEELAHNAENLRKVKEMLENVQIEKRDLVALNNELSSKLHQSKSNAKAEYVVVEKVKNPEGTPLQQLNADENPMDFQETEVYQQSTNEFEFGSQPPSQSQRSMGDVLIQMQEERSQVTELMGKLAESNTANDNLQKQLHRKEQQIGQLETKLKDVEESQGESRGKVDELYKQIDAMQHELQKRQDQTRSPPIEDIQTYRAQVYSLCEELKTTTHHLESKQDNVKQLEERCQQLQNKCVLYQEEIENQRTRDDQLIEALRVTITSLEHDLRAEQTKFKSKSAAHDELTKKFGSLINDYHELVKCNEDLQNMQVTAAGRSGLGADIRKQFEQQIDHLTAQVVGGEEAVKKREKKIEQLTTLKNDLEEQVPVLHAQADVYRQDFEAERSAREALHTEKEALKEEIEQLQLRNQQLQDELQNLSHAQLGDMQQGARGGQHQYMMQPRPAELANWQEGRGSPGTAHGHTRYNYSIDQCDEDIKGHDGPRAGALEERGGLNLTIDQPPAPENPYGCPKCNGNFQSMDELQLHVMDCID